MIKLTDQMKNVGADHIDDRSTLRQIALALESHGYDKDSSNDQHHSEFLDRIYVDANELPSLRVDSPYPLKNSYEPVDELHARANFLIDNNVVFNDNVCFEIRSKESLDKYDWELESSDFESLSCVGSIGARRPSKDCAMIFEKNDRNEENGVTLDQFMNEPYMYIETKDALKTLLSKDASDYTLAYKLNEIGRLEKSSLNMLIQAQKVPEDLFGDIYRGKLDNGKTVAYTLAAQGRLPAEYKLDPDVMSLKNDDGKTVADAVEQRTQRLAEKKEAELGR
jgi:hypothetical protein